ncbi:hypothetical protein QA601_18085 [Chitinispirillales bacterium ANBcel5]|uniref:hypothetical protein n=1 Tax=Cellulosispirillum alkaliphilum TaxID=3039283 RepID=UPI002A55AA82|nr:hypothetical protein [Chitinispirillales bacterium ANBcel5]
MPESLRNKYIPASAISVLLVIGLHGKLFADDIQSSIEGIFSNYDLNFALIMFVAGVLSGLVPVGIILELRRKGKKKKDIIDSKLRQKIEKEENERIRKIVMAQVYCDIKTQIEKHEWQRIENEVREKLHREAKRKVSEDKKKESELSR